MGKKVAAGPHSIMLGEPRQTLSPMTISQLSHSGLMGKLEGFLGTENQKESGQRAQGESVYGQEGERITPRQCIV